ncbi:PREDICTED: pleckstrin homology-like domain family B member 1 isoform X3 [Priapulus caudatus]|uniref:Pleckstrin homology-like domain family B member 1 isoform X3 n=1 Tax=Priapulus caudatus TaxID=37621 RepID=A0ABM1DZZ5_PRICU|nr:PREDICTED: pleckstrin homology-like domain family B member 1 isoform X3 [Priapulus caudatus]
MSSRTEPAAVANGDVRAIRHESPTKDKLAVTETGKGLKVHTDGPHLVSCGGGRLSTSVTLLPLSEGKTVIGAADANNSPDIEIEGTGVEINHCSIECTGDVVTIHPVAPLCFIDRICISKPTQLTQGCTVCLGRSNLFRFNHPSEAEKIKSTLPNNARITQPPLGFLPAASQNDDNYLRMLAENNINTKDSDGGERQNSISETAEKMQISQIDGEDFIMGATPRRKSASRSTASPDKVIAPYCERIPSNPGANSRIEPPSPNSPTIANGKPTTGTAGCGRVCNRPPQPATAVISNRTVSLKRIAGAAPKPTAAAMLNPATQKILLPSSSSPKQRTFKEHIAQKPAEPVKTAEQLAMEMQAEILGLDEILTACVEYEQQAQREKEETLKRAKRQKDNQTKRIMTNGSLPRDTRKNASPTSPKPFPLPQKQEDASNQISGHAPRSPFLRRAPLSPNSPGLQRANMHMGISHRVGSPIRTNAPHSFSTTPSAADSTDTAQPDGDTSPGSGPSVAVATAAPAGAGVEATSPGSGDKSVDVITCALGSAGSGGIPGGAGSPGGVIPPYEPARCDAAAKTPLIHSNVNLYADEDTETNDDNYVEFEKVNDLIARTVASLADMEHASALSPPPPPPPVHVVVTSAQVHAPPPHVADASGAIAARTENGCAVPTGKQRAGSTAVISDVQVCLGGGQQSDITSCSGEQRGAASGDEKQSGAAPPENEQRVDSVSQAEVQRSPRGVAASSPAVTLSIQSHAALPDKLQIHTVVLTADPAKVLSPSRAQDGASSSSLPQRKATNSAPLCDLPLKMECVMGLEPVAEELEHEEEESDGGDTDDRAAATLTAPVGASGESARTGEEPSLQQAELKRSKIEVARKIDIKHRRSPERSLQVAPPFKKEATTGEQRLPRSPRTPSSPGKDFEFPVMLPQDNDLRKHVYKLKSTKSDLIKRISLMKHDIVDIETQQGEAIRELEMERALLEGEHQVQMEKLQHDQKRINQLKGRHVALQQSAAVQRAKSQKRIETERVKLEALEHHLYMMEQQLEDISSEQEEEELLVDYKIEQEKLENERKLFEDLEFQQLEAEARFEEEQEQLQTQLMDEQNMLIDKYKAREAKLQEIDSQQREMLNQVKLQTEALERDRQKLVEEFRREKMRLGILDRKIKQFTALGLMTPMESVENSENNSERSSDNELDNALPRSRDLEERLSKLTVNEGLEYQSKHVSYASTVTDSSHESTPELHAAAPPPRVPASAAADHPTSLALRGVGAPRPRGGLATTLSVETTDSALPSSEETSPQSVDTPSEEAKPKKCVQWEEEEEEQEEEEDGSRDDGVVSPGSDSGLSPSSDGVAPPTSCESLSSDTVTVTMDTAAADSEEHAPVDDSKPYDGSIPPIPRPAVRRELHRAMSDTMFEIEKHRLMVLEREGINIIDEEKRRLCELKRRASEEVRMQWEQRKQQELNEVNRKSNNSVDSEDSSLSSCETPSEKETSLSSGEDNLEKLAEMERMLSLAQSEKLAMIEKQVQQRETEMLALQEERERREELERRLIEETLRREEIISAEVKLREKRNQNSAQQSRPLTRYLPVRNKDFDLAQHIESSGHNIDGCAHVSLTATTCHGYLSKMGSKFKTWNRRWFVFDRQKRSLVYYSDKSESKPRGGIYFQAITEVYVDHLHTVRSPEPKLTFCVKTLDRTYYLQAPTPEAMRIWVDVIFTGAEGYQEFLQ